MREKKWRLRQRRDIPSWFVFFCALGVSEEQANADAEGTEHHLSQETLLAIERFLDQKN